MKLEMTNYDDYVIYNNMKIELEREKQSSGRANVSRKGLINKSQ